MWAQLNSFWAQLNNMWHKTCWFVLDSQKKFQHEKIQYQTGILTCHHQHGLSEYWFCAAPNVARWAKAVNIMFQYFLRLNFSQCYVIKIEIKTFTRCVTIATLGSYTVIERKVGLCIFGSLVRFVMGHFCHPNLLTIGGAENVSESITLNLMPILIWFQIYS